MKKILLVLSVALAAVLTVPLAGSAAEGDSPRACADLLEGGLVKFGGDVEGSFQTAAPLCNGGVSYTVFFTDYATGADLAQPLVFTAAGDGSILFHTTVNPSTVAVCIYAEASVGRGHHVIDRIPDTGCHGVSVGGTVVYDYDYPF